MDTHIILALVRQRIDDFPAPIRRIITSHDDEFVASAASLWEIAIKVRIGKLRIPFSLSHVPLALQTLGCRLLAIDERHALADIDPVPRTHDPFDRMLLAQCAIEDMRLVTVDRALVDHPLSATSRPRLG